MIRQAYIIGRVEDEYGFKEDGRIPCDIFHPEAKLISSELAYEQWTSKLRHSPAIDIDHDCRIVASTTPGHSHLYIDVEMSWRQYKRILKAMAKAGVVERGYYRASKQRRATMLRLPWIKKTPGDLPTGSYHP